MTDVVTKEEKNDYDSLALSTYDYSLWSCRDQLNVSENQYLYSKKKEWISKQIK